MEQRVAQRFLEPIRRVSEQRESLARQYEQENEVLRDQLQRITQQQDAQMNEVAEMLYQEGLAEVIPCSPSEQVAYLLVERASLLERPDDPQGAPLHSQSPWKRLFGHRKAAQSRHPFTSVELKPGSELGSALSVEREWARLERDLEEASRRLAMAHKEIRHLTDELESARMTQSAYEPELQGAQQEVELLRHEVEKLKKCDVVELRKAKELNDRLNQEIRALRTRVRTMDAERKALIEMREEQSVPQTHSVSLQTDLQLVDQHKTDKRSLQQSETRYKLDEMQHQIQRLQEKYDELINAIKNAQEEYEELKKRREEEEKVLELLMERTEEVEEEFEEITSRKKEEERLCKDLKTKMDEEKKDYEFMKRVREEMELNLNEPLVQNEQQQRRPVKEVQTKIPADYVNLKELLEASQEDCEELKERFMEVLSSLDLERSENAKKRSQHKTKMQRAKQIFFKETGWRDEKIRNLERDLALALTSSTREKEMIGNMNKENEKLLAEKRDLLGRLNDLEDKTYNSVISATASQFSVDFLEKENKHLQETIVEMSRLIPSGKALQHALKNLKISRSTDVQELKNFFSFDSPVVMPCIQETRKFQPGSLDVRGLLDIIQRSRSSHSEDSMSPLSTLTRHPVEMGYLNVTPSTGICDKNLNLTSALTRADHQILSDTNSDVEEV
ncbi:coiled-coil domain-containing protein 30 isoform X2 [Esox lucius]|uniref:coiled-coil domain-containing protein 30 isoform X2 n=1 Tax=Esox lucius TaxID=8010 RepID=UPI00147767F8|nr:coiled-coil domain-containing protein 30 isoform X2 [Esox lucius]